MPPTQPSAANRKRGKSAKVKGKAGERKWCKILDELLPLYHPWHRDLGVNGKQDFGDIAPHQTDSPYYVEVKTYQSIRHKQVIDWMNDAKDRARGAGRMFTWLCIKVDRFPPTVFMDASPSGPLKLRAGALGVFLFKL